MRQAIVTKYLGATNQRGSRIVAECAGGRIIVPYYSEMNTEENHFHAAMKLAHKMGWYGPRFEGHWIAGGLPGNSGNVYCYNDELPDTQYKIEAP